ncbi:MAG TPA: formylglycine-generating enzyme family protein [Opitutaceae bacterium]|nr:formylglycine-generating enzyme family protein [Opitutaceae bacterium]
MKSSVQRLLACAGFLLGGSAGFGGAGNGAPPESAAAVATAPGMIRIPDGSYAPILRSKDEPGSVAVAAFLLDARPVTNAEFLAFVRANPKWRRSAVTPLFADAGYLGDWAEDLEPGPLAPPNSPVVRISWFAARAYAASQGKRLPTTAEWERAAAAGFTQDAGASEPGFNLAALAWFGRPMPSPLPAVGTGRPNFFGAHDLLTLVWEWVDDFNTAMVTGESRADTGLERALFCGAAAAGARDLTNYPAFMRAGMRSSVRASYVIPNLGFRCAKSL